MPKGRPLQRFNQIPTCEIIQTGVVLMPSNHNPQLGSLAIHGPSQNSQTVHVSPSTCRDLSLFKGEFYLDARSTFQLVPYLKQTSLGNTVA